jgi:hypothetical protein
VSDAHELRNRATRLLAMAYKAGKEGYLDRAERFTQRASEILDQPTALERVGVSTAKLLTARRGIPYRGEHSQAAKCAPANIEGHSAAAEFS